MAKKESAAKPDPTARVVGVTSDGHVSAKVRLSDGREVVLLAAGTGSYDGNRAARDVFVAALALTLGQEV